jgi:4-hydroxy-3-polyprenylbenzoate decarboxylase
LEIVVGVSGASGAVYGYRLLEMLRSVPNVGTHLVLTRTGERTGYLELGIKASDWKALANHYYSLEDLGCRLASGSFITHGMVVAPCSIHSMSAIAFGISGNLLVRAADVTLKERRKLILMVRETPFHLGHLRTMTALAEMGAIIAPPIPAFYHKPESVMDIVNSSVERVMDLLNIPSPNAKRWSGPEGTV